MSQEIAEIFTKEVVCLHEVPQTSSSYHPDTDLLKLRPHQHQTVARLIRIYLQDTLEFGHFPILERVGVVSYKLKFPDSACVHVVFHISQLKCAIGNYSVEPILLKGLEMEPEELEEPEEMIASCEIELKLEINGQN